VPGFTGALDNSKMREALGACTWQAGWWQKRSSAGAIDGREGTR